MAKKKTAKARTTKGKDAVKAKAGKAKAAKAKAAKAKAAKPKAGKAKAGGWGGARVGAGRKPKGDEAGMAHTPRERVTKAHPVSVTIRLESKLPSLRRKAVAEMFRAALHLIVERREFRVVAYSIQKDHIHLLIESDNRKCLAEGMRGLQIRLARGLNRIWEREGRVFRDRYYDRVLKTPVAVREAFCDILNNHYKHSVKPAQKLDPYASGAWFDGWKQKLKAKPRDATPEHVAQPKGALCRVGWRRRGLISLNEVPVSSDQELPPSFAKSIE